MSARSVSHALIESHVALDDVELDLLMQPCIEERITVIVTNMRKISNCCLSCSALTPMLTTKDTRQAHLEHHEWSRM